jgi:hypothetical protein
MSPRFVFLAGMIFVAALSRLIPHPPNFAPIAALALFGGAEFSSKRDAFLVPLAAMFLSDLILGLHGLILVVYGTCALIVALGFCLRGRRTVGGIALLSVASAFLFFIITNFAVWASGTLYPMTSTGLTECFVAAIPFFRNTLLSNLLYAALLFGALALAEKRWPILSDRRDQPAACCA